MAKIAASIAALITFRSLSVKAGSEPRAHETNTSPVKKKETVHDPADSVTIHGTVTDISKNRLVNVLIELDASTYTLTDPEGHYSLTIRSAEKPVNIYFSVPGYTRTVEAGIPLWAILILMFCFMKMI